MRLTFLCATTFALALAACSSGKGDSNPPPSTTPPPPACAEKWTAAKVVLLTSCVGCHDGVKHPPLLPEATFDADAAGVRAQVDGGKMPPAPATLSAADKATLDAYLSCIGK